MVPYDTSPFPRSKTDLISMIECYMLIRRITNILLYFQSLLPSPATSLSFCYKDNGGDFTQSSASQLLARLRETVKVSAVCSPGIELKQPTPWCLLRNDHWIARAQQRPPPSIRSAYRHFVVTERTPQGALRPAMTCCPATFLPPVFRCEQRSALCFST